MSHRTVTALCFVLLACDFVVAQSIADLQQHRAMQSIEARFTGVVRGQDASPVKNAEISIQDVNTGKVIASCYSNSDGTFAIDNLVPGTYEVITRSGITEGRQRLELTGGETSIEIRISQAATTGNHPAGATISVGEMKASNSEQHELAKARELISKKKFEEAHHTLDNLLNENPTYSDALTLRAILSFQGRQTQAAEQDLDNAIKADPSQSSAYIVLGGVFNSEARFDDALRELERGESLNPASWQAHFEKAKALLGKKEFESSLKEVAKAATLMPQDYPLLHIVKADALIGLQDFKGAIAELKTYLDKVPEGPNSIAARQQLSRVEAAAQGE
jgi:predicted Zn-dependent protease